MSRPSASYKRGATCVSGWEITEGGAPLADALRAVLRSFAGQPVQGALLGLASVPTAVSETAPFLIGPNRAAQALVQEISAYHALRAGWDGEGALAPDDSALCDAARFVYAAGRVPGLVSRLETSLNADGTVALDVDGGDGTLVFKGNDTIVHALAGLEPAVIEFYDDAIPPELLRALIG